MKEIYSSSVSGGSFEIPDTEMPGNTNSLKISVSHWGDSGLLDMDLDVSYDGGETWFYGGGCKGAVSDPKGIEFHFTYQQNPTRIKGRFSSEGLVVATLTVTAGN